MEESRTGRGPRRKKGRSTDSIKRKDETIAMDSARTKEDSELNETRITRMLRERSNDDLERLIKASVNWLGVSDEIQESITKMLESCKHERPAEEEDSRK